MQLPEELIERFSAFASAGVRYLLVGGHAVAAHGRPRSTKDVDLWLGPSADNIRRACEGLARFGAPSEIVEALRTSGLSDIVWMGRAPSRVDLLRSLPGVGFEEAWRRRVGVRIGGVIVQVIGKADLIENKRTVGRPQDRRDVAALEKALPVPRKKPSGRTSGKRSRS